MTVSRSSLAALALVVGAGLAPVGVATSASADPVSVDCDELRQRLARANTREANAERRMEQNPTPWTRQNYEKARDTANRLQRKYGRYCA